MMVFVEHMTDLAMERRHLLQADRHIAEGSARIARQELLIETMKSRRQYTGDGLRTLHLMRETLALMAAHREMILDVLA